MPITKATASSIAPAAKGDLVVGSATNDASVLAVGTNDQVLTADSSTTTGLKWAAVSSPTAASWTPVLSATTTNPTIGNGFRRGYYTKTGNFVILNFEWQWGSTSTLGTGHFHIKSADLPATTVTEQNYRGHGFFTDASAGNKYPLTLFRSGFDFYFYYGWPNGAGLVDFTAAAPVTIAANDIIDVKIMYESS